MISMDYADATDKYKISVHPRNPRIKNGF